MGQHSGFFQNSPTQECGLFVQAPGIFLNPTSMGSFEFLHIDATPQSSAFSILIKLPVFSWWPFLKHMLMTCLVLKFEGFT